MDLREIQQPLAARGSAADTPAAWSGDIGRAVYAADLRDTLGLASYVPVGSADHDGVRRGLI